MSFLVTIRAITPRDFFFVKLVTFFQLLAASTLSTGPVYVVWLLSYVGFAIVTQAVGEIGKPLSEGEIGARMPARGAGRSVLGVSAFVFARFSCWASGSFSSCRAPGMLRSGT